MKVINIKKIHINFTRFVAMLFACILFILSIEMANPNIALGATDLFPEFEKVSESRNLVLYCRKTDGAIAIEDKRNGYVWKSVVSEEDYDIASATVQWRTYMKSMLVITHYDMEKNQSASARSYSFSDKVEVNVEQIDRVLAITYSFIDQGINITLEVELEDDCAIFRLPKEKIEQTGTRGLINVELMPFFGAAGRDVDGYIFYPDGSGALTRVCFVFIMELIIKCTSSLIGAFKRSLRKIIVLISSINFKFQHIHITPKTNILRFQLLIFMRE